MTTPWQQRVRGAGRVDSTPVPAVLSAGTGMPRPGMRQELFHAGLHRRFVHPGRVRAVDGTGHGGHVSGEGAGVGDALEAQCVESPAKVPEGGEAVEQARSEGVPGADGVHNVHGRGWDGDAEAVYGCE